MAGMSKWLFVVQNFKLKDLLGFVDGYDLDLVGPGPVSELLILDRSDLSGLAFDILGFAIDLRSHHRRSEESEIFKGQFSVCIENKSFDLFSHKQLLVLWTNSVNITVRLRCFDGMLLMDLFELIWYGRWLHQKSNLYK